MAAARAPFNVTDKISPEAEAAERSPWHSPVPYLFGGLAAMLGLIAFALLILACSYWKLSGYLENGDGAGERDLEAGEGKQTETEKVNQSAMEPKFLVVMPGQLKPTFLATPVSSSSSRSASFGSEKSSGGEEEEGDKQGKEEEEGVCVCGGSRVEETQSSVSHGESEQMRRR